MAPSRVIIDTDPGTDDVLALLLAFCASPEEIEVLLISITFGNVDAQNCLRNLVSMFHVIQKEMTWRRSQGMPEGFETLKKFKPVVAVGAEDPLGDPRAKAAYFHGNDGLGGVHSSHPHHSYPAEIWNSLFNRPPSETLLTTAAVDVVQTDLASPISLFTPSIRASHLEMIKILADNPPGTITIIAVGPLTNLALAASHSPNIFMRAKSVLVMGGALYVPGNATPVAEFNTLADPSAAARIFALTSPDPASTMPPTVSPKSLKSDGNGLQPTILPPYPPTDALDGKRLNVILFPLDLTDVHYLRRDEFNAKTQPLIEAGSPLAEWVSAFLQATFTRMEKLHHGQGGGGTHLSLHDPVCVWYALIGESLKEQWTISEGEDIRVETTGHWTKGMCVVDRRNRKMGEDGEGGEVLGDTGGWLSRRRGNRVRRCVGTPGERALAPALLDIIFGHTR
ncbi:hypothetical protein MMC07_007282 [Pseudocyphellaria aurata]|nr:hypothetical protein [Pseudocyphellaria aurata]